MQRIAGELGYQSHITVPQYLAKRAGWHIVVAGSRAPVAERFRPHASNADVVRREPLKRSLRFLALYFYSGDSRKAVEPPHCFIAAARSSLAATALPPDTATAYACSKARSVGRLAIFTRAKSSALRRSLPLPA